MRILIIGGAGFVGSHVVDRFCAAGINPIVLDRDLERYRKPVPGVTYVKGDFGNRGQIEEVLSGGIDVLVHLASGTIPSTSNEDPIFDIQTNLVESVALFEACVRHKVKKVIFASSGGTVYGRPTELPLSEGHDAFPMCSYGIVKLAIEKYLAFFQQNYGLNYCALRISNPYGIRQSPDSKQGAVAVFSGQVMRGEGITIWGDGSAVRDYINVVDVAEAFYRAAVSDKVGLYNVGSGVGVSLTELIATIGRVVGVEPEVQFAAPRSFDVPSVILDCSKANEAFDWGPRISLENGISAYVDWLRNLMDETR